MDYKKLSKQEFDALVTGEMTHYALWFESEIIDIISDQLASRAWRSHFERLVLRRDALTFQDKIEIARGMIPLFSDGAAARRLKTHLKKVEDFKATRNALSHGVDVTPDNVRPPTLHIETVGRSGRTKIAIVSPDSHQSAMANAEQLLKDLQAVRAQLR